MSSCCDTNCQHESNQKGYYTCPMHPEIKEDKPGKCPKCGGMDLVKKSELDGGETHCDHNHENAQADHNEKEPTGTLKKFFWKIGKTDAQKKENHSNKHGGGGCC